MSSDDRPDTDSLFRRVHGEVIDSFDEELEMELDDERLTKLLTDIAEEPNEQTIDRHRYFHELFRLQGELVKLQDWVVQQEAQSGRDLRRPGRRGQGWRHQAHYAAPESTGLPHRRSAGAQRT